jgi:hypothetical protein
MNKKNRFNLVSLFILEQMQFLPKKTPWFFSTENCVFQYGTFFL